MWDWPLYRNNLGFYTLEYIVNYFVYSKMFHFKFLSFFILLRSIPFHLEIVMDNKNSLLLNNN